MRLAVGALILWLTALVQPCAAQERFAYKIGPYPVPIQKDELSTTLDTWAEFIPIIDRINGRVGLKVIVSTDLDNVSGMVNSYIVSRFNQDNCGRKGVDNWVYGVRARRPQVTASEQLRIEGRGAVATWTCLPGIPETVSQWDDTGCNAGSIIYGCFVLRTREGSPIKSENWSQGLVVTQNINLRLTSSRTVELTVPNPVVECVGGLEDFCNSLVFIFYGMGTALHDAVNANHQLFKLPQDTAPLGLKYEVAEFYTQDGHAFGRVGASAWISLDQLNGYMRAKFPGRWKDIAPFSSGPAGGMTKAAIRAECAKYSPGKSVRDCAAGMGWAYDDLPD